MKNNIIFVAISAAAVAVIHPIKAVVDTFKAISDVEQGIEKEEIFDIYN